MKKIMSSLAVAGLGAAIALGSLMGAGAANASEGGYLSDVAVVGYGVDTSTKLDVGHGTCTMLTSARTTGMSPAVGLASVRTMFLTSGFTPKASATVIYASVTQLCPANFNYMMAGADAISGNSGGSLYA
jgi:hypothetical protein